MSVMLAAGHWYTSGAVIGWVGVAVAAVIGVSAVVMWRLGMPSKKILYAARATSLLSTPGSLDASLEVRYDGKPVHAPIVVSLRVESRSRRDIGADDFDSDLPLVFDLGAEILAPVGVNSLEAYLDDERLQFTGSKVLILPRLIRKGTLLHIDLLASGEFALTPKNPIRDVRLSTSSARSRSAAYGWLALVGTVTAIAAAVTNAGVPAVVVLFWAALSIVVLLGLWRMWSFYLNALRDESDS
jgi:hypothetical protein